MKRLARAMLVLFLALAAVACGGKTEQQQAKAPKLEPADPVAVKRMITGVQRAKDGKAKEAIELLEEAISKDPNLWEAHYDLGLVRASVGELEKAEEALTKAAELAPNAEDVAVALAEVQRRRGNARMAADGLQRFVKAHDDAIVARIALVSAFRESGQVGKAIDEARAVLVRRSGDPDALAELALSHLEREEIDTADLLIQEALKSERKSAVAERAAGLIALKKGDDALAFSHFVKASELDPKDTTARLNMGTVLLQAGIYDKADEQFRAVLEVKPDDVDATLGLAAALRGQGGRDKDAPYKEAEKLLTKLLDKSPKHVAATWNLAVLYVDYLQQPQKAKPLLQAFLKNAPKNHPRREGAQKRLAGIK